MKTEVLRVTNEAKKTRKNGKKPEHGFDILVNGPPQGAMWKNQESTYIFGDQCFDINSRNWFQDKESAKLVSWSLTIPRPQSITIPTQEILVTETALPSDEEPNDPVKKR